METNLIIGGMTCSGCVASVRKVLSAVEGVSTVSVDLEQGRATVTSGEAIDASRLVAAVEDAGYDAREA